MDSHQKAYIAGLLDGDGSIMLQFKRVAGMKFLFRIKTTIVIYQDTKLYSEVEKLKNILEVGYLYQRNDHISEIRIEGFSAVESILKQLKPYIRFKQKQVALMLEAISMLKTKYSLQDFIAICQISDAISTANYSSKNRKYTSAYVLSELEKHHLIPVTT